MLSFWVTITSPLFQIANHGMLNRFFVRSQARFSQQLASAWARLLPGGGGGESCASVRHHAKREDCPLPPASERGEVW
jgi:hypothetical protein